MFNKDYKNSRFSADAIVSITILQCRLGCCNDIDLVSSRIECKKSKLLYQHDFVESLFLFFVKAENNVSMLDAATLYTKKS